MAYRLIAHIDGKAHRIPLSEGEHVLGSGKDCTIRIDQATVSRRHALVNVGQNGVLIEDLGSRNGLRVGAEKVRRARLAPGARILVGSVPIRVEELPEADLEAGLLLDSVTGEESSSGGMATTSAAGPVEAFVLSRLPGLLRRLRTSDDAGVVAQAVGEALFGTLPCLAVEVTCNENAAERGILFSARREQSGGLRPEVVTCQIGCRELRLELPSQRSAEVARPVAGLAAEILAIAEQMDAEVDDPAGEDWVAPSVPDPPSVVPQMQEIYRDAGRVARGGVSVLVLGESGTGKELLAHYIHDASRRSGGPFLGLNCASLPQDLLEAELFGIEKGVATGVDARAGRFEQANGGTLFLDEIGDMASETQAKILRVLQSGEVYRLGGRDPRTVDVRIVSATNRDIHGLMSTQIFRQDLYHRIATWVVELPPLRQRVADIPNLAAFFLRREARRQGIRVGGISRAALEVMQSFGWPGNVRQLENEMARAVLFLEDGELLDTSRLSAEVRRNARFGASASLAERLEALERSEITNALALSAGNVEAAAQRLGISRATLYRRMRSLGIDVSS